MRKITISLILLILTVGCVEQKETGKVEAPRTEKTLSELQIEACNAAHSAGTCDSRLAELGIVLKEECCEVLGKCC